MNRTVTAALAAAALFSAPAGAQEWTSNDPVLQRIWQEGMQNSQVQRLGQALMDSIGPRLTGTPGQDAAHRWAVAQYRGWGINARSEQYGTWRGWRRGVTHADLVQPRVRSLEATMLAWSPGTGGQPVTGPAIILPEFADSAAFQAWLPQAQGKWVMISAAQPTCRPDDNYARWARPADYEHMRTQRTEMLAAWNRRIAATGLTARELPRRLEAAGAAGILTNLWSQGWGVDKIFQARTERIATLDVSCEDYGLVFRLAENNQGPVVRVTAEAEHTAEVPAKNTLAEVRGRRLPGEYVMLSAHFDSWDASSGATDNGTGTVVMMEAMRILRAAYPNPKRTILAGHWSGEEQGLNGSRGFAADNPRVVQGLQALFNQDNGTGRIVQVGMQGFTETAPFFRRWFARMPGMLVDSIEIGDPGSPASGGSDHAAFVCYGAPAFGLGSLSWDYGAYTWHTNRDSYDKVSWEEVRRNATLVAMLVYLASEDNERLPRTQRTEFPVNAQTGQPGAWPTCQQPARNTAQSTR
jgi:carboxypeptidase Q